MIDLNLDVNKIKKDILKLAKKIGVEEAAIEKAYKMYEKKLIKEGVSEENLEERTWISVQRSLKRKVLQSGNNLKEDPGFYNTMQIEKGFEPGRFSFGVRYTF